MEIMKYLFSYILLLIKEDDLNTIKEFLRISLHTIFFHRWLGESNFEDVESQFSNINYVRLNISYNVDKIKKFRIR